jgi:hypothetical protein
VSATTECVSADSRSLPRRCSARAESFERNGPCGDSRAGQCSYVFELNFSDLQYSPNDCEKSTPAPPLRVRPVGRSGRPQARAPADEDMAARREIDSAIAGAKAVLLLINPYLRGQSDQAQRVPGAGVDD